MYLEGRRIHQYSGCYRCGWRLGWNRCQRRGSHTHCTPFHKDMTSLWKHERQITLFIFCCFIFTVKSQTLSSYLCASVIVIYCNYQLVVFLIPTAELVSSPVVWSATSMNTLSGKLWHSVAQAEWVNGSLAGVATVAEVCNTGRSKGGHVQATLAALESRSSEDVLTQRFLKVGRTQADSSEINLQTTCCCGWCLPPWGFTDN